MSGPGSGRRGSVSGKSSAAGASSSAKTKHSQPSPVQKRYLSLGLKQPGGKLPLFDGDGQRVSPRTIRACVEAGWCEPWHKNPIEPRWLVCRLTERGKEVADKA